jgi:hypothetical protein
MVKLAVYAGFTLIMDRIVEAEKQNIPYHTEEASGGRFRIIRLNKVRGFDALAINS